MRKGGSHEERKKGSQEIRKGEGRKGEREGSSQEERKWRRAKQERVKVRK